jgi:broad specificity phosphatase PhoE
MSSLTLVRHAQASFFAEDYDQLSEQGERQSAALGAYWLAQDRRIDEVYVGPRTRHRRTAEIIEECYRDAGRDWPDIVSLDDFDEHHVDQLARMEGTSLADNLSDLEPLAGKFREAQDPVEKQRAFQLFFEALVGYWVAGKTGEEIESWQQFRRRILHGLEHVISANDLSGRRVAIFTSVGPITVILQRALQCPDKSALETGWRTWNCSLTEFAFSGQRLTLDRFNALPHITDTSQWTYR